MAAEKKQPESKKDGSEASVSAEPSTLREKLHAKVSGALALLQTLPSWAKENRLKAAIFGGIGVILATVATTLLLWVGGQSKTVDDPALVLTEALEKLSSGQVFEAKLMAESIQNATNLPYDLLGGPLYVLGQAAFHEAEESTWDKADKRLKNLLAARYLEESNDRGFPPGYEVDGFATLGSARFNSRQYSQAKQPLKEALELADDQATKTAMHGLLHQVYTLDARPSYPNALTHVNEYLADPNILGDLRSEAMLAKGWIHFRLDEIAETRKALAAIPDDAANGAEAYILAGQVSMWEADRLLQDPALVKANTNKDQAGKKYDEAIKMFGLAQQRDTILNTATRKAAYLLGVTWRRMGELQEAAAQLDDAHMRHIDFPEGMSAALEFAEVRIELRHYKESVEAFHTALRRAGNPDKYINPWISLDDFQRRVEAGYNDLLKAEKHELAIELTTGMRPLFSRERVTELKAKALEDWGNSLFREADEAPENEAEEIAKRARETMRKAGKMYSILAQYRIATRQYSDDIWRAANSFLAGQNYVRSASMLRKYLENESREKRAVALVSLGKSLLSLGNPENIDEALQVLGECIEFYPNDPAIYEARLLASQAHKERIGREQKEGISDIDKAIELLDENLYSGLRPESNEWRDSMFAIGELYFLQGSMKEINAKSVVVVPNDKNAHLQRLKLLEDAADSFNEANKKLDEAVKRYPDNEKTIFAHYMLAESYQRSSQVPREKLPWNTIGTTRRDLVDARDDLLTRAHTAYQEIQKRLNEIEASRQLTSMEKAILQNSMFSQGASLFAMEQYDRASAAYEKISGRYTKEPAVLEALVQKSRCERKLNRTKTARQTIQLAKMKLSDFPPETDFASETRFNRKQWEGLLDWLRTL